MTVLEKEKLKEHAGEVGQYLLKKAQDLQKKHETIGKLFVSFIIHCKVLKSYYKAK